ncbi:hypothetical protein GCM10017559_07800 [Streptosporangium longisporum]|uniref:AntA/AntB antirepressor domain-containing protein n=1 Tax=Streptosporangium longisporum TaxID=46187 RepID=A0ABN3XRH0_9ACTN
MNELALTESPSLRAEHMGRVDVLDKVKAISLLPDDTHADVAIVATYYEVGTGTIDSLVRRNRAELERNGLRVIKGEEYREFATVTLKIANSKARSTTLFSRRTILNVGQLLVESPVAKSVRSYLLDVEELAPPEIRTEALERAALSRAQVLMLKAADGFLDRGWLVAKTKLVVARGLGEEPEIDPAEAPLYVPDFLKSKGLRKSEIASVQSTFGRRAAALHEAEHGFKPGKRQAEVSGGSIRNTLAWTQRHVPLFEEVWDRWYAAQYSPQAALLSLP